MLVKNNQFLELNQLTHCKRYKHQNHRTLV